MGFLLGFCLIFMFKNDKNNNQYVAFLIPPQITYEEFVWVTLLIPSLIIMSGFIKLVVLPRW